MNKKRKIPCFAHYFFCILFPTPAWSAAPPPAQPAPSFERVPVPYVELPYAPGVGDRHNAAINVLWADGHADTQRQKVLEAGMTSEKNPAGKILLRKSQITFLSGCGNSKKRRNIPPFFYGADSAFQRTFTPSRPCATAMRCPGCFQPDLEKPPMGVIMPLQRRRPAET
ncbi:hypothetical protein FYJ85_21125 [Victivallaceae bacterium BBE-744-WT-12]|uniref:Uncharacterized protein n=1 Tax=Victivallis lenta TaxID=2606640 RepID=A0A844G9B5_9BACT|nr:hypothetical protein [Victivallis lenta]